LTIIEKREKEKKKGILRASKLLVLILNFIEKQKQKKAGILHLKSQPFGFISGALCRLANQNTAQ
jgi:hypothetical protein